MDEQIIKTYRNKRFHTWNGSKKAKEMSKEQKIEYSKDKIDQWEYNLKKLQDEASN